jgi:uncharacterized protein YbjT (DUF2867 family)
MSTPPSLSATLIGSTGLTGSHILSTLLQDSRWSSVRTVSRRAPKATGATLDAVVEPDSSKWPSLLASSSSSPPTAVISALGTTRAAAGGLDQQWKIDHDLNIELAKAAKEQGAKVFTFISSAGTDGLGARAPYSRMKLGVENAVRDLDFDASVIVKPGMILGNREEGRLAEGIAQRLVHGLGSIRPAWRDGLGQEADVIARAAVKATQLAAEGKAPSKHWVLYGADIIKLGQKE